MNGLKGAAENGEFLAYSDYVLGAKMLCVWGPGAFALDVGLLVSWPT